MRFALLLAFLGYQQVFSANVRIDPLVHIDQGLVRGEKSNDGSYSYFLGIPYAQVDVNNPFGPALAAPFFDGTFLGYDDSIKCPQVGSDGILDCLRLNIYVPSAASSRNPLPVLVWIHGGGFQAGSGSDFEPSRLVQHGVVVVTINYRLGPYGFMCLDNPRVPGNQGLKDQYAALRWVRNNIAAFGGNPYQVTLGGESAGSASVLYHLYSSNEKLYTKVIVQSDTPQNEGMFARKDNDAAVKLARQLGFDTSDTDQALNFLRDASPSLVAAASHELNLKLRPCQENSYDGVDNFLDKDPFSLSNQRKVRNTPVLIGHTTKEHKDVLFDLYGNDYLNRNPFYEKLKENFNFDEEVLTMLSDIVQHFYIGDEPISSELLPVLEDFDSDFVFYHPIQRTVTNLLSEDASAIYQYLFSYVGDSEHNGVGHAAENDYLFENPKIPRNAEDQLMVDRMTTLWTNFIKYGNPTPEETNTVPVIWEPISLNSRPYLVLDAFLRVENRVFNDRMAFWDLFYSVFEERNVYADAKRK